MCHNAKIRILISFANFLILILISFLPSWRNAGMRLYGKFCFFVYAASFILTRIDSGKDGLII